MTHPAPFPDTPQPGSRWQVGKHHVYEFVRIDGSDHVMRLVAGTTPEGERAGFVRGFEMRVEPAWFVVRGDVRRVG